MAPTLVRAFLEFLGSDAAQLWRVGSWQGELSCVGSWEERFEGCGERKARWFIPVRAVGIQAESRVDLFDVGKVRNVGKALKVGIVSARMV